MIKKIKLFSPKPQPISSLWINRILLTLLIVVSLVAGYYSTQYRYANRIINKLEQQIDVLEGGGL